MDAISKEMLKEFEGSPIEFGSLPQYDQEALSFFTNLAFIDDPFVDFSFNHDITQFVENFQKVKESLPESTLTGYLIWLASRSLLEIPHLNWRKFGGTWYEFKNTPIYMPVATGTESRLRSTFLKNIRGSTFADFSAHYQELVDLAKDGKTATLGAADLFFLAHNIVNLPNLKFTALKPHSGAQKSTHVWWAMGQRYQEGGRHWIPMMIRMHHANGDPVILQRLLMTFDRGIDLSYTKQKR